MFTPDAGWVSLTVGLAAVAGRTYLGRYRMSEKRFLEARDTVRDALWTNRDLIADHLLTHEDHPHACGIPAQLELVGWSVGAFIVATGFDTRELLDD